MIVDGDLPERGTADEPLSFDEGATALEGILGDPAPKPDLKEARVQKKAKASEADEEAEAEEDQPDASETEEDDAADAEADEDDAEDTEESDEADDEDEDGAVELTDETVIDLGDGRQASLAELKRDFGQVQKRIADFQRDYTQKTTALSDRSKTIEAQEARVLQHAQQVAQHRDLVLRFIQARMPSPPETPTVPWSEDPAQWGEYSERKANYDRQVAEINQFWHHVQQQAQAESAQVAEHQRQNLMKAIDGERERLLQYHPELSDRETAEKIRDKMARVFESEYGFEPEVWQGVYDARQVRFMVDAINWKEKADAYDKLMAGKPKAMAKVVKVKSDQKMLGAGKANSAKDAKGKRRSAKFGRLRKEGSFEAAVDALLEFDL